MNDDSQGQGHAVAVYETEIGMSFCAALAAGVNGPCLVRTPIESLRVGKTQRRQQMVRAKFTVSKIESHFYAGKEQPGKTVVLTPQYDESIPEDRRFAKATPSGEMRMYIDNPSAVEYLKAGEAFYVDFTAVEKPVSA